MTQEYKKQQEDDEYVRRTRNAIRVNIIAIIVAVIIAAVCGVVWFATH